MNNKFYLKYFYLPSIFLNNYSNKIWSLYQQTKAVRLIDYIKMLFQ